MFSFWSTNSSNILRLMFWWLKLVPHFLIFISWLPDRGHTSGTCCATKRLVRNSAALTAPSASLFHHCPPASLFSSLGLSLGLWSPAALDSLSALKSSLALLACQAAEGNKQLFKILCSPPSSHVHLFAFTLLLSQNFSFLLSPLFLTLLRRPASCFDPFTTSCFPSPHVAADHQALFLLLSRLPGDWVDCAQQNIVLLWSGQGAVRRAGLCVPFGCHSTQQQGLADKHTTRDLGGPSTAQWKWASHWETWSWLPCSQY